MKKLTIMLMLLAVNPAFAKKSGVRLTLLGGPGPTGLQTINFGDFQTIGVQRGFVIGGSIQIDTTKDDKQHLQFMGLSNGTFLVGYGIDL